MLPILESSDVDRRVIRLSKFEIDDPRAVLEELCAEYEIGDLREQLEECVESALSYDDLYNDPATRRRLLFWGKVMERALESIYVLMSSKGTFAKAGEDKSDYK